MKRFLLLISIVFIVYVSKPYWEKPVQQLVPSTVINFIQSTIESIKDNQELSLAIETINQQFNSVIDSFDRQSPESKYTRVDPPTLTVPTEQLFSVHNIELGDSKADVEQKTGEPKRSSVNEYGVSWNTYHENYQNFLMVAYDENDIVRGLYTNQDLIASTIGIKRGIQKQFVQEQLGTPESSIRKGFTNYMINSNGEYDVFKLDNSYVTIFYDIHENNTVTAIQVIDEKLERDKAAFYGEPSQQLKEGFEYQLFDITNATRVNHELSILTWDDHVRETARGHSLDMAENQYFGHTNLQGQSPFDRMEEDNINYRTAGENLAYGQSSSIFAHEGLMNSLGHRKNILQDHYKKLGIGVAFNNESQPYYTEMFYSE